MILIKLGPQKVKKILKIVKRVVKWFIRVSK